MRDLNVKEKLALRIKKKLIMKYWLGVSQGVQKASSIVAGGQFREPSTFRERAGRSC
jgi:hypothetical protein